MYFLAALSLSYMLASAAATACDTGNNMAAAVHAITNKCLTHDSHNACNEYLMSALATCSPEDSSCKAEKLADSFDYCRIVCSNSDYISDATRNFLELNGESAFLAARGLRSEDNTFEAPIRDTSADPETTDIFGVGRPQSTKVMRAYAKPIVSDIQKKSVNFEKAKRSLADSMVKIRLHDPQKDKYLNPPEENELVIDDRFSQVPQGKSAQLYVDDNHSRPSKNTIEDSKPAPNKKINEELEMAREVSNAMSRANPFGANTISKVTDVNDDHGRSFDESDLADKIHYSEDSGDHKITSATAIDYVTLYEDDFSTPVTTSVSATTSITTTPNCSSTATTSMSGHASNYVQRIRDKFNINLVSNNTGFYSNTTGASTRAPNNTTQSRFPSNRSPMNSAVRSFPVSINKLIVLVLAIQYIA